jgi:hypothetical protein
MPNIEKDSMIANLHHLQVAEDIAHSDQLMENFHSLSGGSRSRSRSRSNSRSFRKSNRRGRRNTTSRSNRLKHSNRSRHFVGGGRTWNVPIANPSAPFEMPGPSHNNGWNTGAACAGSHCGVPVTPSVNNMIHNNLQGDFTLQVPGSTTQYMVGSGEQLPGVQLYGGTESNPGPFNFNCVSGGGKMHNNHNSHRANLSRRARYLRNRR